MIRLSKGPAPEVLTQNAERWTRELLEAIDQRDDEEVRRRKKKYNHPDVKQALREETNRKCAYCESHVTAVSHGDIEHITAKSLDPRLTFEWTNLTFACQICNQRKSTSEDVLDPYNVDPASHILFIGPFAKARTRDGMLTISIVDMNRLDLLEIRQRELRRFSDAFERILQQNDDEARSILINGLKGEVDLASTPYVAMLRDAWSAYGRALFDSD